MTDGCLPTGPTRSLKLPPVSVTARGCGETPGRENSLAVAARRLAPATRRHSGHATVPRRGSGPPPRCQSFALRPRRPPDRGGGRCSASSLPCSARSASAGSPTGGIDAAARPSSLESSSSARRRRREDAGDRRKALELLAEALADEGDPGLAEEAERARLGRVAAKRGRRARACRRGRDRRDTARGGHVVTTIPYVSARDFGALAARTKLVRIVLAVVLVALVLAAAAAARHPQRRAPAVRSGRRRAAWSFSISRPASPPTPIHGSTRSLQQLDRPGGPVRARRFLERRPTRPSRPERPHRRWSRSSATSRCRPSPLRGAAEPPGESLGAVLHERNTRSPWHSIKRERSSLQDTLGGGPSC